MSRLLVLLVLPLWLLGGCASPRKFSTEPGLSSAHRDHVWMVSNGFHTSLALRAQDAPADIRTLDRKARFFVIGWGGRDFYMGRVHHVWDYFRTVLLPTPSTLHIIPIRKDLIEQFPRAEIVEYEVEAAGLQRVRDRLEADFVRDAKGNFIINGPGRFPQSHFFAGSETYFIPKTCNMWTASHLKSAGIPITVCMAINAPNICWQGRRQGRVLSTLKLPREVL